MRFTWFLNIMNMNVENNTVSSEVFNLLTLRHGERCTHNSLFLVDYKNHNRETWPYRHCFWVTIIQRKKSVWRKLCVVSSSTAIHIAAHLCNLERYHLSQSAAAEGLLAALSKLGDTPNESYINPIRTPHTVSSPCMLSSFSSEKSFLLQSLQNQEPYFKSF